MAAHSDKSLLTGLTDVINQYCKQNNINPNSIEIKKALATLGRKWDTDNNVYLVYFRYEHAEAQGIYGIYTNKTDALNGWIENAAEFQFSGPDDCSELYFVKLSQDRRKLYAYLVF